MGFVGCSQGALVNRRHNLELEKGDAAVLRA